MFFLTYSTASHSVVLNVSNGNLLGASSVAINGVLYDVAFQDGTCEQLYSGCDQNSDFPFANPLDIDDGALGLAANLALLEQVFIDSPLGAFDSIPSLTNGCFAIGSCLIRTPLFVAGNRLGVQALLNRNNIDGDIGTLSGAGSRDFDTRIQDPRNDSHVYAVWSQSSVSEVPIPAGVWLLGSGLIGLVGMRKKSTNISGKFT